MKRPPATSTRARLVTTVQRLGLILHTILPIVVLIDYMAVDRVWSGREIVLALATVAVVHPFIYWMLITLHSRLNRPFIYALDRLEAGQPLTESDLARARKSLLAAPWRSGIASMAVWTVIYPLLIYVAIRLGGGRPDAWRETLLGGLVVGPLVGMVGLLATNLVWRPAIARLFPDGGIDDFVSPLTLTVRKKLSLVFFFLGPYSTALLALLAYRRVAISQNVPEALNHLVPLLTFLFVISLGILVLGVFFTRENIGRPLAGMLDALGQVRDGNFTVRLPVESDDSFGLVADRFNHMVKGLEERERLRAAFGRYVSPEIAQEASYGELVLGGGIRRCSVLFSDIRSFTSLSERMDPAALVELLNRYFGVMVACIRAEGGSVNKFIGDGIMALFGAPSPLEDPPLAAVRAAMAMKESLEAFNAEQRALGLPELSMGMGITTGPVIVGNIGSPDRLEYTAIGDTVNTASRIEGLTKDLMTTILFDEATCEAVAGHIPVSEKGNLPVKGKSEPVRVFSPKEQPVSASEGMASAREP